MRALSDEATFTVQPGIGTTVQLTKLLSRDEPAEPPSSTRPRRGAYRCVMRDPSGAGSSSEQPAPA